MKRKPRHCWRGEAGGQNLGSNRRFENRVEGGAEFRSQHGKRVSVSITPLISGPGGLLSVVEHIIVGVLELDLQDQFASPPLGARSPPTGQPRFLDWICHIPRSSRHFLSVLWRRLKKLFEDRLPHRTIEVKWCAG
jgi:hypothetical protein